jgi:hypothetical protein
MIWLKEPSEVCASRNAMAEIIGEAPAHAPFKCVRCNRVHRAQALRSLVHLRCRACHGWDFVPVTVCRGRGVGAVMNADAKRRLLAILAEDASFGCRCPTVSLSVGIEASIGSPSAVRFCCFLSATA